MQDKFGQHDKSIRCVSDAYLCSACGGCRAVCGHKAITFSDSPIGRRYAVVGNSCTNCGMCQQVCPTLALNTALPRDIDNKYIGTIRDVYIGRSTNSIIYKNAQSGGVCTALLTHLFDTGAIDGAIVVRMDYGKVPQVRGVLVTSSQELLATQKSCYTPVDLLSVLNDCIDLQSLAIVGLPCHIEAIENIQAVLPRRFVNIKYRIGLICDRTLSGGIQDVICRIAETGMGGGKNSLERQIHWRDKTVSTKKKTLLRYANAPLVVCDERGDKIVLPRHIRIVLKDMFTAPRCRVCYDKLNIFSDITLGDPWEMTGVDWDNGDSLIITRTENGENLLKQAVNAGIIRMRLGNTDEMLRAQGVERRCEQVLRYSTAYCKFPFALAAPICSTKLTEEKCEREYAVLQTFLTYDTKSKDELYAIASEIIHKYERTQRLYYRIWRKIKKILKKL